jgi:hypothetical protein
MALTKSLGGSGGGGGSAPAVQEEGVTVTAAAATLNFVGAGVTATDVAGVATITVPTGAGLVAKYSEWNYRVADASPHALTDEFTSDTKASYTAVYGTGDSGSPVVDVDTSHRGRLYIYAPYVSGTNYHMHTLLKALPAGDFTIFTAMRMQGAGGDSSFGGLILSTASTAASGSQQAFCMARTASSASGDQTVCTLQWNGFGSSAAGAASANFRRWEHYEAIIRVQRSGTTVTVAFSTDGMTWTIPATVSNAAWTHFGLFGQNYSAATSGGGVPYSFDFLRYYATAAQTNTGGLLTVYG